MQEMIKNAMLSSTLYPLLVGFLITAILGRLLQGKSSRDWIAGLALAAAFLTTFFTTVELADFPPVRVLDWTPYGVILGLVVATLIPAEKPVFHIIGGLVVSAVIAWLFLKPLGQRWETGTYLMWMVATIVILTSLHATASTENPEEDGQTRLLMMVIFATGVSLLSILNESAKLAQITGGLAASCGAIFLGRLVAKEIPVGRIVNGVFLATMACLMLNIYHYVEVPTWSILVILLAHLSRLLLRLPAFQAMTATKRGMLSVVVALIPVAITIGYLVITAEPPSEDEYDYY